MIVVLEMILRLRSMVWYRSRCCILVHRKKHAVYMGLFRDLFGQVMILVLTIVS